MVDFNRARGSRDDDRGRGRDDDRGRGRDDDRGSRASSRDDPPRRGRDDDRGSRSSGRGDDRGRSSGSGQRYEYHRRTREETQHRESMGATDYDKILKDGAKMFTPSKGDNRLRFLPPTFAVPEGKKGHDHYGMDIFVHYGVGPDRGSYLCLDKMRGEPCPICEERAELVRDGRATDKELKDLNPKRRVLVYVVDRDDEGEGVQAWAQPWTLDKEIYLQSVDQETNELINIDDPKEGYDVHFRKEGEKDRTEYLAPGIARRSSPLGKAEWLDFAVDNPLDGLLNYFPYADIAKAFGGAGAHRDSDRGAERETAPADRGGDRGRDRGDRDDRGRDDARGSRGSDGRQRGGGRDEGPAYEDVMAMTSAELDALCESDDRLKDIDPMKAKDDDELRGWICEDLKLEPAEPASRRGSAPLPDSEAADRLAKMRDERGGGRERR